jgi:hypothetical protein
MVRRVTGPGGPKETGMTGIVTKETLLESMRVMALSRLRLVSALMANEREDNADEVAQARTAYVVAVNRYMALETALLSRDINMVYDEREGREIALARRFMLEAR